MWQEINEYEKYLLNFGVLNKPKMPKFNVSAYTDNEYTLAIFDILRDFDLFDDMYLTVNRFKGD